MGTPNNDALTVERAREILRYEPVTGRLYRRVGAANHVKAGDEAGWTETINGIRYRRVRVSGRLYYAHRLAWLIVTGEWPKGQVDHEDGDGLNNRWENLRDATHQQNQQNRKLSRNNTSGVTGVCRHKLTGKWQTKIKVNGKDKHLGLFEDLEDAASARKEAEEKYGYHENHGRKVA